ncbi:hypothetical protein SVAN01_09370 [Stagonosporopsis vannaccii]|nr:hypothetical protein SVAN01_09370 [Stagonosporopsis vannaccii]
MIIARTQISSEALSKLGGHLRTLLCGKVAITPKTSCRGGGVGDTSQNLAVRKRCAQREMPQSTTLLASKEGSYSRLGVWQAVSPFLFPAEHAALRERKMAFLAPFISDHKYIYPICPVDAASRALVHIFSGVGNARHRKPGKLPAGAFVGTPHTSEVLNVSLFGAGFSADWVKAIVCRLVLHLNIKAIIILMVGHFDVLIGPVVFALPHALAHILFKVPSRLATPAFFAFPLSSNAVVCPPCSVSCLLPQLVDVARGHLDAKKIWFNIHGGGL